jgi:hypothetical protein
VFRHDLHKNFPFGIKALIFIIKLLSFRYYKHTVNQESGWNQEVISWCQNEAQRQHLKPADYWGGLVLDEMKIQVFLNLNQWRTGMHYI